MKQYLHKKASHFPFAALLYFVLLILLLSNSVRAEAQDMHDRIMFQHPFFKNHNWKLSSDSIVFNVNSTFKNHTPSDVSVAGNDTTAWFTYNYNNKVYILKSVITYPASQFQNVSLSTDEPVELTSIPTNRINCLFVPNQASPNKLLYATSDSSLIRLVSIDGTTKSITFDSTANYGVLSKIYSIYGTDYNKSLTPTGPSVWVGAENGALTRLLISDLSSVTTESYDISGSEIITAITQDQCGTESGKIFELQSNTFVEIFSSAGAPVIKLTNNTGITENGNILLLINNNWNFFNSSLDSLNVINKVFRRDGSGAELLNANWNYSVITLSDSTTDISFDNSSFNSEWSSVGSGNLTLTQNVSITLNLSDHDKNYTLPLFILNNNDKLLKNDSIYISNSIPDREFSTDTSDFADSTLQISFTSNDISITLTTRKRTYNPISFKHSWTVSEENYNFSWEKNSSLKISLNGDSLVLNNYIDQVVTAFKKMDNFYTKNIRVSIKNGKLVLPKDIKKEYSLALYSLDGKKLLHETIRPGTSKITFNNNLGKQMLIAVLFLSDGNRIKIPISYYK